MKTQYILHCHENILLEELTEPIENRIEYIKKNKPANEVPLRLLVMRVLTDEEVATIPVEAWDKALENVIDACEAYKKSPDKTLEAWDKALEAWEEILFSPIMIAWHQKVCKPECTWNGAELVF